MLIEFVKDFNGPFVIGCANRLFTVGAVEIQHGMLSTRLDHGARLGFSPMSSSICLSNASQDFLEWFLQKIRAMTQTALIGC
jgi:hypothetical protein